MMAFLFKGLVRDRNRSLFPLLVVTGGMAITVLTHCFMLGVMDDMVRLNARLNTGHVKVMTRAYDEIASQLPNDLALEEVGLLLSQLKGLYPDLDWILRIPGSGDFWIFPTQRGKRAHRGPWRASASISSIRGRESWSA